MSEADILHDCHALADIHESDGFGVVRRLADAAQRDLFVAWRAKQSVGGHQVTQEWADGYNAALDHLFQNIEEMVKRAEDQEKPLTPDGLRQSTGVFGLGRGELAG